MGCEGTCVRFKAVKRVYRYANGQRRCRGCEIFMDYYGLFCPCCGYRLRTKPRNRIHKAKLLSPDCMRY